MTVLRLAWRQLRRDLAAGEVREAREVARLERIEDRRRLSSETGHISGQ